MHRHAADVDLVGHVQLAEVFAALLGQQGQRRSRKRLAERRRAEVFQQVGVLRRLVEQCQRIHRGTGRQFRHLQAGAGWHCRLSEQGNAGIRQQAEARWRDPGPFRGGHGDGIIDVGLCRLRGDGWREDGAAEQVVERVPRVRHRCALRAVE
ncbi:hypothetical protein D3C76_720270 [compost metagenome]